MQTSHRQTIAALPGEQRCAAARTASVPGKGRLPEPPYPPAAVRFTSLRPETSSRSHLRWWRQAQPPVT